MRLVTSIILSIGMIISVTSCQLKGMYVSAKTGGIPVPYNLSLMKKSDLDHQEATGPGYTYSSTTVNGDETIVPKAAVDAYKYIKVAEAAADAFKSWTKSDASVKTTALKEATAQKALTEETAQAGIAADVAKSTAP